MNSVLRSKTLFAETDVFSQGIAAGELTFLAQDARDADGTIGQALSVRDQTAQTVENLTTGLHALGQDLDDVVSLWVLLTDYQDLSEVAGVIEAAFAGSGRPYPATTFLGIMGLEAGCRMSMDAVATTSADRQQIVAPSVPLPAGSHCHGVRTGDLLFLSGMDAANVEGKVPGEATSEVQTLEVLNRLDSILKSQNLSLRNICRTFMFLKGSEHRPGYGDARKKRYQGIFEETEFPPNSGIMVRDLGENILLRSVAIASRQPWQLIASPKVRLSPGSFSQSFRAGDWLFVAGQDAIGFNREMEAVGDLAGQTEASLRYLLYILEAAGGSLRDLVKTTVYLVAGQDRSIFESAWDNFFRRQGVTERPAGHSFEVKELAPQCLVEIDGVALLESH